MTETKALLEGFQRSGRNPRPRPINTKQTAVFGAMRPRLRGLHGNVVLHEQLVDTEIHTRNVFDNGQSADQCRNQSGADRRLAVANTESNQPGAAEYEAECRVVLHRDEARQHLHERDVPGVPAGNDDHSQDESRNAQYQADGPEGSLKRVRLKVSLVQISSRKSYAKCIFCR